MACLFIHNKGLYTKACSELFDASINNMKEPGVLHRKPRSLHWRRMSTIDFQIADISTVCLIASPNDNKDIFWLCQLFCYIVS